MSSSRNPIQTSSDSSRLDRQGKVFFVRPDFTRECLICGAVFDVPQATAHHAVTICRPKSISDLKLIMLAKPHRRN